MLRSFLPAPATLVCLLLASYQLSAQNNDRRLLDARLLPATATTPAPFVPKGWKIEQQLSADLNADQRPDQVLMLIEQQAPASDDDTRYRALVVLLTQPDGRLRPAGVGSKLLYCTTCFGALGNPELSKPELRIAKGVLLVEHLSGSRWSNTVLQRFRYEPTTGRMRLIGEDFTAQDRATGNSETRSTNLLTGQQVVERFSGEKRRGTTQRRTVPAPKLYLEDVDPEADQASAWRGNTD
jgi:hypothetical protein